MIQQWKEYQQINYNDKSSGYKRKNCNVFHVKTFPSESDTILTLKVGT